MKPNLTSAQAAYRRRLSQWANDDLLRLVTAAFALRNEVGSDDDAPAVRALVESVDKLAG